MKTSAVIRKAYTEHLWHPDCPDYANAAFCSCNAVCWADSSGRADSYKRLLPPRLKNSALNDKYKWASDMSAAELQEFRFLLLCMAEQYFKSIGD